MNRMLNRVPEVTLYFWIIKIMATTVGETAADFLAFTLNFGLAATSYLMGAILTVVLWNQFRLKRYVPVSYWTVVVLVSIVGTLITDRLVDEMGVSLVTITIVFTLALLGVFALWYNSEKTLAMHSIKTTKRELFYWAAILLTFALGTAAGDLLAEGLRPWLCTISPSVWWCDCHNSYWTLSLQHGCSPDILASIHFDSSFGSIYWRFAVSAR